MEVVLNRVSMFPNEWKMKWVPAVTLHCKNLKKDISKALSAFTEMYSAGQIPFHTNNPAKGQKL